VEEVAFPCFRAVSEEPPTNFFRIEFGFDVMEDGEGRAFRGENFGGADCGKLILGNPRKIDLVVQKGEIKLLLPKSPVSCVSTGT
jgi:hypothetical protein